MFAAWYGALDEVHQAFVPGRESGLSDWLADLSGGWLGVRLAIQQATRQAQALSTPDAVLSDAAGWHSHG